MAPEPHRGKRNDSTYIPYMVAEIARLKNISEDEVKRSHTKMQKSFLGCRKED